MARRRLAASPSRRGAAVAAVSLAGIAIVASCAEVVGVGGNYKSAIGNMCTCENVARAFGGNKTTCVDYFEERLAEGTPSEVRAWLDVYLDLSCDKCSGSYAQTKLECVHTKPFCVDDGGACGSAFECCGYPGTSACLGATVGAGMCGACRAENEPCATDEECCGYHGANAFLGFDPPYCSKDTGTCVREPADCARSFSSCLNRSCCTGDLLSLCQPNGPDSAFKFCVEYCDPSNPHNCPGCCAVTYPDATAPNATGVCADGQPEECGRYCTEEGQPCKTGGTCVRSCEPVAGVLVSLSNCYLTCV